MNFFKRNWFQFIIWVVFLNILVGVLISFNLFPFLGERQNIYFRGLEKLEIAMTEQQKIAYWDTDNDFFYGLNILIQLANYKPEVAKDLKMIFKAFDKKDFREGEKKLLNIFTENREYISSRQEEYLEIILLGIAFVSEEEKKQDALLENLEQSQEPGTKNILAKIYLEKRNYKKAKSLLDVLIKRNNSREILINLGLVNERNNKTLHALQKYEQVYERKPELYLENKMFDLYYRSLKNYEKSLFFLNKSLNGKKYLQEKLILKADIQNELNAPKAALILLEKKSYSPFKKPFITRKNQKILKISENSFLEIIKEMGFVEREQFKNYEKAKAYFLEKNYEKAKIFLEEIRKNGSENKKVIFLLADVYEKQNKLDEAFLLYEGFLKIHPESLEIKNKIGSLYLKQKLYKKSSVIFREILKNNSHDIDALIGLIGGLLESGKKRNIKKELKYLVQDFSNKDLETVWKEIVLRFPDLTEIMDDILIERAKK